MGSVEVDGVALHVEEHGRGEPLLLIHGLGTHAGLWRHQIPAFSGRYRVIAVDLRGFGRSAKPRTPGAYTVERLAADVAGVIGQLGLSDVHVLGCSMGGFIAQVLALDHPGLARSLILAHTGPRMSIPADILASRLASLDSTSMEEYGALVAEQALAPDPDPALFRWLAQMIGGNDKEAYRQVLTEGLQDFDVAARVSQIALPTLVVVGELDRVIPPEEGRELASRIPGAELVTIGGVGHIGYAERPDTFNAAVDAFLGGQVRGI